MDVVGVDTVGGHSTSINGPYKDHPYHTDTQTYAPEGERTPVQATDIRSGERTLVQTNGHADDEG